MEFPTNNNEGEGEGAVTYEPTAALEHLTAKAGRRERCADIVAAATSNGRPHYLRTWQNGHKLSTDFFDNLPRAPVGDADALPAMRVCFGDQGSRDTCFSYSICQGKATRWRS